MTVWGSRWIYEGIRMQHDDQNDQGDTPAQFDTLFEPFELEEPESGLDAPEPDPPAEAAEARADDLSVMRDAQPQLQPAL